MLYNSFCKRKCFVTNFTDYFKKKQKIKNERGKKKCNLKMN